MTISLILDTSTERGIFGFFKDELQIYKQELPVGLQSSKFLIPNLEKAFRELNLKPADLAYIAVGVGPGSYTGIRIAAMTAKIMAYALKIPLIGICSLQGFIPANDCVFIAMIDGKIGGVYIQKGIKKESVVSFENDAELVPFEELGHILKEMDTIVTPNSLTLKRKISMAYPDLNIHWEETGLSLHELKKIADKKWRQKEYSTDGSLTLLYLRKTQAEMERE